MKNINETPEYCQNLNKMLQRADSYGKDDVLAVMNRLREVLELASQKNFTEKPTFEKKWTLH